MFVCIYIFVFKYCVYLNVLFMYCLYLFVLFCALHVFTCFYIHMLSMYLFLFMFCVYFNVYFMYFLWERQEVKQKL